MHPAPSVILFTALSGLGFGLLAFLGLNMPDVTGWVAFIFFFIAFALAVGGLLASTFHLGNPKNALMAFSQWRTSWLSREGVVAVAALITIGLYAALVIFFDIKIALLGILGSILCLGAVFCTSMIYAQLKTIPRWNHFLTPILFMLFTLAGGSLLSGQVGLAKYLLIALLIVQIAYWMIGDGQLAKTGSDLGTATGLGNLGQVRQFEAPHTGNNYLLREMVHVVGRKHAMKLRIIAAVFLGLIPILILFVATPTHTIGAIVVLAHLIGLLVARWLFFAEAEHVVGIYYDKR